MEQTSIEESRYEYRSTIVFDPNRISCSYRVRSARSPTEGLQGYLWPPYGFPEAILLATDVVDANGVSIQNSGEGQRGLATHGSGDVTEGLRTETVISFGSGRDAAAFIRYVIASDPYEQKIRLALEDVPTPDL